MENFAKSHDIESRFERVEGRFKNYLLETTFKTHQKSTLDSVTIWKERINTFDINNLQMKKIISRFDEVLLGK